MRRHLSLTVIVALVGFAFAVAGEWQILTLINSRHHDAIVRETESKEHQSNAAINRAINVETWCGELNAILTTDRRLIRLAAPNLVTFALPPLDCLHIIRETLQSGAHKPHVTPTNYPLVYQALQK